jgi:hypothetical protein
MDLARSEASSGRHSCVQVVHELIRPESLCRRNKGRRVLVATRTTQNRSRAPRRLLQICPAEAGRQLRHVRKSPPSRAASAAPRARLCAFLIRKGQQFS